MTLKHIKVVLFCVIAPFQFQQKATCAPISDPISLAGLETITLPFEDLAGFGGEQFGFGVGQPYASAGLFMGHQVVVEDTDIGGASGGISLRNASVYSGLESSWGLNLQYIAFNSGQRGIGFYLRDALADSVTVDAYDVDHNLIESVFLPPSDSTRYVGFLREAADIVWVEVLAPHATVDEAFASPTFIDDLSFGSLMVPEPSSLALICVAIVIFMPKMRGT
jgi:hypothetical protein